MIAIIDYNVGNVGSIENMLRKIGHQAVITADHEVLKNADKLILPGVGAFDNGMENLKTQGLVDLLTERVLEHKVPILGICLGMQLLTEQSEEGKQPGLGFFKARTVRFKAECEGVKISIPHIGWNYVNEKLESKIFVNSYPKQRYYFVHSYYVQCEEEQDIAGITEYGGIFASAIERNNIFGVQFHPEKSHKFGMNLLKNFAELV